MFEEANLRNLVLSSAVFRLIGLGLVVTLLGCGGVEKELPAQSYNHNWDDNPVAYIPEAEVIEQRAGYDHNWDENPVAYIPEAEVIEQSTGYDHNWDDIPSAYIPEAEVIEQPRDQTSE